jgi:Carboxypeptidase regulatory-like domain/TonB dependent receptor-like, beta-barrel
MTSMRRRWLSAFGAAMLVATPALGQEYRGRVQGSLTDQSRLVLPGVQVTLLNDATGVAVTRITGPEGRYLFDYVDPGTYTLTAELSGFAKVVQRNVIVQARGDVTVDVMMKVAGLAETVTVEHSPVAIQFNTSSKDLTLDQKMVQSLPVISRNPTQLAYLSPVVRNAGNKNETSPYHHWAGNDMDVGGGTYRRNDVLLDGTPLEAGPKVAYTPPMDAVAEFNVATNAVDAEYGHSAGGIISMSLKSGTNQYHGSGYFVGRNPDWNAVTNRVSRQHSNNAYSQAGGTLGMPLRRNRVFLFGTFESSRVTEVLPRALTLPTALERQGDFSQSYNRDGSLRLIYDPWTSRFAADGRTIIRDPFPGNRVPSERWDPLAARLMQSLWSPNGVGDDRTGLNNFQYNQEYDFLYVNFSTRLDWNISSRWKTFARVSRFQTDQDMPDFTGGGDPFKLRPQQGSKRNGWNVAGDAVYTMNANTAFDVRGAYYQVEDKRDYPDLAVTPADYRDLWPNGWFEPYLDGRPILYFPEIAMGNYGTYGVGSTWWQIPEGYSLHGRFNKYLQRHSIKAGSEVRWKRGEAARFRFYNFVVNANATADTTSSPNLQRVGHPWASFLLGALDNSSSAQYVPMQRSDTEMYALYVQDDFRLHNSLTLNLGVRWEYEAGLFDPEYRLPRDMDLSQPISGMQEAIDPLIPADVRAMMAQSAGQTRYIYNGAFYFTDKDYPRNVSPTLTQFMPRVGLAWTFDRLTAIRAGYGRFYTPQMLVDQNDTMGQLDLGAFSPVTSILPAVQGVPQVRLSDPFPQGLTPAYGKRYGTYTGLGDNVRWDEYRQRPSISDRVSFSVQRELWGRTVLDVSYLLNNISRDGYTKNFNMMDPRLSFQYGAQLSQAVPNPFFNYGTVDTFPGQLRSRATVSRADLLKPYPQYLSLLQDWTNGRNARYHTFELRLQRPFRQGLSLLAGYAYVRGSRQEFYDNVDEYDERWTWIDASDPRHRLNVSAVWNVPIGRDQPLGREISRALDALVGGWEIAGVYRYESGQYLRFGGMIAPDATPPTTGNVGAGTFWFDTTGFERLPAFTRRANPWQYDGLKGPNYTNLDLSLSKRVPLRGNTKLNLRMEAYNVLNGMNWANPSTTIGASDFGQVLRQADAYFGRQLQYTMRVEF